jgi:hypothetical protein
MTVVSGPDRRSGWRRLVPPALRGLRARLREAAKEVWFPRRVQRLSGKRRVRTSRQELVVVCLVRDGAAYVPEFLAHYRALGAKHIVLLDNGSRDGTPALAGAEPDVTVFGTLAPYKDYKDIMKRWLVRRFGRGNWVLCVDIDELFDFPGRDRIGLAGLLRYLDEKRFTAVLAHLLDMFPDGPIIGEPGGRWRQDHRFYDLSALERQPYRSFYGDTNRLPHEGFEIFYGGIRSAVFQARVLLSKHPLLFPSGGLTYLNAHHVAGARVADISAVLLHYKYAGDFEALVDKAVKEESYAVESREYKRYQSVLTADRSVSLHSSHASEYRGPDDLLDTGFLLAPARWRAAAGASTDDARGQPG